MLVTMALLLALVPALVILYPFLGKRARSRRLEDEGSSQAELSRRWDAAFAGLKGTELEWTIGNLAESDYSRLREQYMTEAALVMKAMKPKQKQERELGSAIRRRGRRARTRPGRRRAHR